MKKQEQIGAVPLLLYICLFGAAWYGVEWVWRNTDYLFFSQATNTYCPTGLENYYFFIMAGITAAVGVISFLWYCFSRQADTIFVSSIYTALSYWLISYPIDKIPFSLWVVGAILLVYVFISMIMPIREPKKKDYVHGLDIDFPGGNGGIDIGTFSKKILPDYIQQFVSENYDKKIKLPYDRLSRGLAIFGDMGSGKSRLMYLMEEEVRKRYPNIPILIHDPKGEWLRNFYNPETDLIFAPYDKRSIQWDILSDIEKHPELRHPILQTAIENHHDGTGGRFWIDGAVNILKNAFLNTSLDKAIEALLIQKDANSKDKTWLSTYSTALIGFRDIATIALTQSGRKMGIDEIVNHKGRIFLLNNPSTAAEQKGAFSIFLSAFYMRILAKPDIEAGKLYACSIIDEALTFTLPADIEKAVVSQSRSKGLFTVFSAQRYPNIHRGEQATWAEHATHIITMRMSEMESRKKLSTLAGTFIYNEEMISTSKTMGKESKSKSYTEREHKTLTPETIGNLKNREFILFHETGITPGYTPLYDVEQNNDVKNIDYADRLDVTKKLKDL